MAILTLFATLLVSSAASATDKPTIYFYNSETNVNNYATLKRAFDTYLSKSGPFQFQPFSERATFDEQMKSGTNGIYLLSSWHYLDMRNKIAMTPALVGVYKSKNTQKHVLTVKKKVTSIDAISGRTIASAGAEEYTRYVISKTLQPESRSVIDTMKVLTVPKDIDALMAVGFGMAQAAFTTERSLQKLSMLNPKQYQSLNRIAISGDTLLTMALVPTSYATSEEAQTVLAVLEKMGSEPEGAKMIKLLGLDGWQKLGAPEKAILGE